MGRKSAVAKSIATPKVTDKTYKPEIPASQDQADKLFTRIAENEHEIRNRVGDIDDEIAAYKEKIKTLQRKRDERLGSELPAQQEACIAALAEYIKCTNPDVNEKTGIRFENGVVEISRCPPSYVARNDDEQMAGMEIIELARRKPTEVDANAYIRITLLRDPLKRDNAFLEDYLKHSGVVSHRIIEIKPAIFVSDEAKKRLKVDWPTPFV